MNNKLSVAFLFSLLFYNSLFGQKEKLYSYQDLSEFSFRKEKDSIKKSWQCPEVFKDKTTQNKFKEIWNGRTDFVVNSIEENDYIKEDIIYNYVNRIIIDIVKENKGLIKKTPLLIIDRSSAVNAYCVGNNIIVVNLGLITFSNCREEIALAIAHELSHNVLKHPENAIQERAVLLTSAEYKKSLEAILDSKYERLTKLKKIIEGYAFSRSRHNRYHESEADSLAIILLRNSHIPFNPEFFLRLDSADTQYKQELNKPIKNYFLPYNLPIEEWWFVKRSKGLSSKKYNFKDSTVMDDSLKTHPDCIERYSKNKSLGTLNDSFTLIPKNVLEKANKILIWNMFNNLNLTACLYRIFLEKDKGNTDEWYDFMIHNIFSGIYYSNLQLNRFGAIGIKPKEFVSKSYLELQNMLEQIPSENLEALYKQMGNQNFWANMPDDSKQLKALMSFINFESPASDKKKSLAAKDFINNNPTSMYCEFAEHFKN